MNPNIIVYGWVCPFQFQIAPLGFSQCPKIHSLSSPRKLRKRTQVNQNSSTGQSPGNVLHKYCFTHPSSIIDNCLDVQKPLFEVGLYHRMVKVGRNFWRSSGPTSFRTHYPGLCTDVFCISLVKKDSITSLGNLLQHAVTLTVKFFLTIRQSILYFHCARCFSSYHWTTQKGSDNPPFRNLYPLIRSHLNLLFPRQNGPNSVSLS